MTPHSDLPRTDLFLALAFLAVVAGGITDLVLDAPRHWGTPHVLFEVALVALSLGLAVFLWWSWYRTRRALVNTHRALAERGAERDRWQASTRKLLDDLGRALDRQFSDWSLTPAGLGGRAAPAAFFLCDLLPPPPDSADQSPR